MFIREAQINHQLTSATTDSPTDGTSNVSPSNDDPEDATLRHQMTAKGFFKSRNTLRVEEKDRKRQKKVSTIDQDNIIDLTYVANQNDMKRAEAATQHAAAASLQAISGMFHTQLDALERAKKMGVNEKDLRPFILHTLSNLYTSSDTAMKKLGHHVTGREDDPEVTFLGVRKSLERKMANERADEMESEPEDDCECAAGYMCLKKDVEIVLNDPKCDVCKRQAHNLCLATDDVRTACFKCFGEDDDEI
jgi:hypothetical protein